MFKEFGDRVDYPKMEEAVLQFWKEHDVFRRSVTERAGKKGYTFYEGPPTANGRPGIHHVMSRTLKDLVCRYHTMKGMQVHRKAGWDTHGLPVEIEVEKSLGFRHKEDIVRFGVAKFNDECRKSVWRYKQEWERLTDRMGYWVDLASPYVTFEDDYIESVWWSLKRYYDDGLIYKGYKIQPYCPRCETPLSTHEVSLGYEDVSDPSIYVKAPVKGEKGTYFLVWTTTPWTLISNVALAVHAGVDYVKVRHGEDLLILAEARLSVLDGEYEIIERFRGSALRGMEYERLYNYHELDSRAFFVVEADFVTTEDGSGIVHMAPAYGEDDYHTSRRHNIPTIHPVDKSGNFGPEVTDFAGMFVKDADPLIIKNLKERKLLYKKTTITHSYPHCWRCGTPLLYYARESWYIATTRYAKRMIELNDTIHWYPPEVGTGRFGNWLGENKDWSLSRDRFWGTPLPIWICGECGKQKCVGSIAELREGTGVPEPLDLHKPHVDDVVFRCSCGGGMRRTPELIDVWYDSGAMPFAQWHYPFENREIFESRHPADFICEGIDQTRGWFYSLHAISTFLFDRPAYRNLIVNELILDAQGQKMSKSKGNSVDPFGVIEKYGADTVRWYLVATSPPWKPTLFDEGGLLEVQRKFFGTLVNTYAFFALYANIDGYDGAGVGAEVPRSERPEIDRWILSELHSLLGRYRELMDAYDVTKAARAVSAFTIDQLSNWYVRRNRRRFWKNEEGGDKRSAYRTLHECLSVVSKLLAPFAPFLAEELHRNLAGQRPGGGTDSVHLALLGEPDPSAIDRELEARMEKAQAIVTLVRSIRNRTNLKVRQPLRRLIVPVSSDWERAQIERMKSVILDETNVKSIEFVGDDAGIVRKSIKPNFKVLGPKYGKAVQGIAAAIRGFGDAEIRALEREGSCPVTPGGTGGTVLREDVEIIREDIEGWAVETDNRLTVALDTELDPVLIGEGFAREFVNRVQNLRKDSGFKVTDRIAIAYRAGERLSSALREHKEYIQNETLAVAFTDAPGGGGDTGEVELNGESCSISIKRIS
ncbi:MAG TPA: isoleucine--tRNA ligase [Bacteroidota bacterium]|nr:isoleucine--tRNA ligase [Bacteroidota bacterium]